MKQNFAIKELSEEKNWHDNEGENSKYLADILVNM
jgi:hypothetical protein